MKLTEIVSDYPVKEDDNLHHMDKVLTSPKGKKQPTGRQRRSHSGWKSTEPASKGPEEAKPPYNRKETRPTTANNTLLAVSNLAVLRIIEIDCRGYSAI